ncbi:MAG TPA: helix-turn-helix transcriptional regulator [Dokdonella sp.]
MLADANTAEHALVAAARRAMAATLAALHRSRGLARSCSGRTRRRRLEQYSRLARARAVLAWGDDPSLDIAGVAAIAHMSTSHFIALFHRIFGRPPHQYRIECRMSQARRLLLDTTLSTIQIVHCLGIESTAAFARTFLRQFGLPASSLRRSHVDDGQRLE